MIFNFMILISVLNLTQLGDARLYKRYRKHKRPNIVFILADDLGWNDVSFHGSPQIPTPNIDALASDGVILNNYYVNSICTPSRSALMSGYYPIHTGMQHDVIFAAEPWGLPLNLTILPQHLQKLGYETHAIGKWHLGYYKWSYTPTHRGFKTYYGYYNGREGYYDHTCLQDPFLGYDFRDNERVAFETGGVYATNLFTQRAEQIIKQHNASQPLFLFLSHLAVHAGNDYSLLEALPQQVRKFPQISDVRRRLFAGMVGSLDRSVGAVFRALREAKLLRNTIVVFTTDNGGAAGGIDKSIGSNFPLRGTKYTLWEGGVRGVASVWSPLLGNPHGAKRSQLMHLIDWLPTLYHAAGGKVRDLGKLDGINVWESILDGSVPSQREELLMNIDPIENLSALRLGDYKLVQGTFQTKYDGWFGPSGRDNESEKVFPSLPDLAGSSMVAQTLRRIGRPFKPPSLDWYLGNEVQCNNLTVTKCEPEMKPCLFDIVKDPCEYNNLALEFPDIVTLLQERLNFYQSTAVKPLKVPSDPKADPKNYNFTWTPWQ